MWPRSWWPESLTAATSGKVCIAARSEWLGQTDTLVITDRAYILEEGTILASGTPEELVKNETVRNAYLGADFSDEFLVEKKRRKGEDSENND